MMRVDTFTSVCILGLALFLGACSSTNSLTLRVTQPAPVDISPGITKVGIIDRSLPTEENKSMDDLDKILSAEGKNLDKDGARAALAGLRDELAGHQLFQGVAMLENANIRSQGVGVFPSMLSWEQVERICLDIGVDALFVLSFYDTDAKVDYKAIPVEIEGPMGVKVPALEHHATVTTLIKSGWRIYDLPVRTVRDEYVVSETVVTTGKGINPMKAAEAVIGRKEAIMQVSNSMGQHYAFRIIPYDIRVSRLYFVRGTDNFKTAKRYARAGDWDGAAGFWEKELGNPKPKVAGRACYNMAIINEINGNLDEAADWAARSYKDYNNKKALDYLRVLKNRMAENERLQQQVR